MDNSKQNTHTGNLFLIRRSEFVISSTLMLQESLNIASIHAHESQLLQTINNYESDLEKFLNNFCQRSEDIFGSKLDFCSQNVNDSMFSRSQSISTLERDEVINSWIAHKLKLYIIKLKKVSEESELPENLIDQIDSEIAKAKNVHNLVVDQQKKYIAA